MGAGAESVETMGLETGLVADAAAVVVAWEGVVVGVVMRRAALMDACFLEKKASALDLKE